jgi:hypothetical protein
MPGSKLASAALRATEDLGWRPQRHDSTVHDVLEDWGRGVWIIADTVYAYMYTEVLPRKYCL